jgi:hypothetical protein
MGLFDSYKKRVSKREMRKVKSYSGLSKLDRKNIDKIFRGDMDETTSRQKGIDEKELKRGIEWMRKNMSKHSLSEEDIKKFEERAYKKL